MLILEMSFCGLIVDARDKTNRDMVLHVQSRSLDDGRFDFLLSLICRALGNISYIAIILVHVQREAEVDNIRRRRKCMVKHSAMLE